METSKKDLLLQRYNMICASKPELAAPEIEKSLLGRLIGQRNAFDSVAEILSEECFTKEKNQKLFSMIKEVASEGLDPDLIMLSQRIIKNPIMTLPELAEIGSCSGSLNNLIYESNILVSYKKRRIAYVTAFDLMTDAINGEKEIDNSMTSAVGLLTDSQMSGYAEDVSMDIVVDKVVQDAIENAKNGNVRKGSLTNFNFIDSKGGLKYSSLIIVAAESSQGKTSFATQLAMNALKSGSKVAFYSMEMTNEELTARVLSGYSGISSSDIMYDRLMPYELKKLEESAKVLKGICSNMHFDDKSTSGIDYIIGSIRSKKYKYGIDGVIVDYLQILNVNMKNVNKEQAMGTIARLLKNLAKELNIWIIAISQLSRDRDNPIPTMARVRDSGQIVEAADEVYLVYRPEAAKMDSYPSPFEKVDIKGTAMVERAKGRNIGLGKWIVRFEANLTQFTDLDQTKLPTFMSGETVNAEEPEVEQDYPF